MAGNGHGDVLTRALDACVKGDTGPLPELFADDVSGWSPNMLVSSLGELTEAVGARDESISNVSILVHGLGPFPIGDEVIEPNGPRLVPCLRPARRGPVRAAGVRGRRRDRRLPRRQRDAVVPQGPRCRAGARVSFLWGVLIVVVADALAITAMLLVRRRAPDLRSRALRRVALLRRHQHEASPRRRRRLRRAPGSDISTGLASTFSSPSRGPEENRPSSGPLSCVPTRTSWSSSSPTTSCSSPPTRSSAPPRRAGRPTG
jgi:hypothetical protein